MSEDQSNPDPTQQPTINRRNFLKRSGGTLIAAAAGGGLIGMLVGGFAGPEVLKAAFDASVEEKGYHRTKIEFLRATLSEKELNEMDSDAAMKLASTRAAQQMVTGGAIAGAALMTTIAAIVKILSEPERTTGPVKTPPKGGAAIG